MRFLCVLIIDLELKCTHCLSLVTLIQKLWTKTFESEAPSLAIESSLVSIFDHKLIILIGYFQVDSYYYKDRFYLDSCRNSYVREVHHFMIAGARQVRKVNLAGFFMFKLKKNHKSFERVQS